MVRQAALWHRESACSSPSTCRPRSARFASMIVFDGVTKRYPDGTVAVDTLSLAAPTGKITVLVGPSGCGKTTSLRMVNRMIEPDVGHHHPRRPRHGADEGVRAAPRHGLRHPARWPVPPPHRPRQHRHGAAAARLGPAAHRGPRARAHGAGRARGGLRRALPLPALRRPAAAGRRRPRPRRRPAGDADGRAVQRRRPGRARAAPGRVPRLQDELGKTIVFVTHDIDEAIKLGDQVAVLRVGGELAQLADPAYLLAHPVDDFVADFVGRDRGYRALTLPAHAPDPRCASSAPSPWARRRTESTPTGFSSSTTNNHPSGWVEPRRIDGEVSTEMLHRGGTVARASGPCAQPRRGPVVAEPPRGHRRRLRPSSARCRAHEVLTAIEEAARPEVADPLNPGAPAP